MCPSWCLGPDVPPCSIIRTWSGTMLVIGVLRSPGRPKWLIKEEDDELYQSVVGLRRHGVIVDTETLVIMACVAVQVSCGPLQGQPWY